MYQQACLLTSGEHDLQPGAFYPEHINKVAPMSWSLHFSIFGSIVWPQNKVNIVGTENNGRPSTGKRTKEAKERLDDRVCLHVSVCKGTTPPTRPHDRLFITQGTAQFRSYYESMTLAWRLERCIMPRYSQNSEQTREYRC